MDTTDKMMGSDQYNDTHQTELSEAQDLFDNTIIKIEEKKAGTSTKRSVKLPLLNIPIFDGSYSAWKSFYDLFEQAVNRDTSVSNVEKFQLLKTLVTGEASQIIKHLQITEDNFKPAWELLQNRYNNERRLIETYVKGIPNQPRISSESAAALKKLHDTTLECLLGAD